MILSNTDILNAIENNKITIEPLEGTDPYGTPFNTSSVDLRLASSISIPNKQPGVSLRLDAGYDKEYVELNSKSYEISESQPYILEPYQFILGKTFERVSFPIGEKGEDSYAARVEGRSSHARRGLLVHFTAPTIHTGFEGPITLEIINLGATSISLVPNIYICQLIIEKVSGQPAQTPNQFSGQSRPSGAI